MAEENANTSALHCVDEPVLVGRGPELARFNKFLADGQPILVVITGGPGVGKTSLLQAFRDQAAAAGWNTAPPAMSSEHILVTPEMTEESFGNQVQALLAKPSNQSFIEKPHVKEPVKTAPAQQPLHAIVQLLRARAPLLLSIDSFWPETTFADWFQNRFMSDLKRAGAPVVVVVAERPEGATKFLSYFADETITLGPMDEQAIRQHFTIIGEKISPPMQKDELNVYVEAAHERPELLGSLTRVLRLALPSATQAT